MKNEKKIPEKKGLRERADEADELTGEMRVRAEAFLQGRRATLKDLHSRGELNGRVMAQELMLLLPPAFVEEYEKLFWQAFRDPWAARVRSGDGSEGLPVEQEGMTKQDKKDRKEGRKVALGKAMGTTGTVMGTETRAQAQGTGRKFKEHGLVMGNEDAFARKRWVDKKLGDLALDIRGSMDAIGKGLDGKLGQKRCAGVGCRRIMDWKWKFCPECGHIGEAKGNSGKS